MEGAERITSRRNAVVKRFRDLARVPLAGGTADGDLTQAASHTAPFADVLLDGEHLMEEALACHIPIEIAAFSDRLTAEPRSRLAQLAETITARGGRLLLVNDEIMAAMSPVQHPSGAVAIGRARSTGLRAIFAAVRADQTTIPLVLVLDGIQDPGNVGAIVRVTAAFGAAGVIALSGTANPFGWKALRGAMGGTFRVPIAQADLPEVLAAARDAHVQILAAAPRDGTPLPHVDLREPTALIVGAEGAGVSSAAVAAASATVTIPMGGAIESLNVAVAAALIVYEASRQRSVPAPRGTAA
jgi:TrmH family RNA methyltransferase